MKLSKKVMTGLLVGAISLSICTPALAAPANNQYYSVKLKANESKVWDVINKSTDNNVAILLYGANNQDNQKFVFFPLDNGRYAIVNKNSGKAVTVGDRNVWGGYMGLLDNSETVTQRSWTGNPIEEWYLRDRGNNYYEIVNQGKGKVASYAWYGTLAQHEEYVDLDNSKPSDADRVFRISATGNTISLPKLPAKGTRPVAPNYTGGIDQQLPQTSKSVVVGASLIPCIMVKDNQASDYTKIHNSPYYTLVKEEFWDKTFSTVIPAGYTRNYSFKTGMSSIDQEKMTDTLSMSIGADLGLKFGQQSASLKTNITKTLQTEISTTNTQMTEETITSTATCEPGKTRTGYTEYQLATKYTLYRQDGSVVSNPWVVKNNKITTVRQISQ